MRNWWIFVVWWSLSTGGVAEEFTKVTHGPVLGRAGAETMSIWVRTSRPAEVRAVVGTDPLFLSRTSGVVRTELENDHTGIVTLGGLKPGTAYHYDVMVDGQRQKRGGNAPHVAFD
ncbi:MAG: PhoD-like phosphatase N-terminal domain-containing protein, partial [Verrucomicrobiota bacterium]